MILHSLWLLPWNAMALWMSVAISTQLPDSVVVDIAPARRPCVGEGVRSCLVVRWAGDSAWRNLSSPIEGFTHESGVFVRLVVKREPIPRPLADGSSRRYVALRECLRVPAGDVTMPARLPKGVAECP
jgi:Domain of unknown function (DUF4377)